MTAPNPARYGCRALQEARDEAAEAGLGLECHHG